MKTALTLILLATTICCFGQQQSMTPFEMAIVLPDTAFIDPSLYPYIDTTVQQAVNEYYALAEQVTELFDSADVTKGPVTAEEVKIVRQNSKATLANAKKFKNDIDHFTYYQTIPIHAALVFGIYFNQSFPLSGFQITGNCKLTVTSLRRMADSLGADYVIGYKDIRTENRAGLISMKMKTILFSRKESKIILSAETTGDGTNYGDIWGCSNPLSCLLLTTLKPSVEKVAEILVKRQQD